MKDEGAIEKTPGLLRGMCDPHLSRGAIPEGEQPAATTSRSVLSHCLVSSSISALTVSSRDTRTSGALQIVIPASGTEDSEEEMEVPAPPPRIAGPPDSSHDHLTEAVTTAVLHRQQMEDEAAASSSSGPEKKPQAPAMGPDPRRPGCSELSEPTGSDPVGTGARKGQGTAKPVETHTWEEMEGAVQQGARGTAEGTMGYALTILDQMWLTCRSSSGLGREPSKPDAGRARNLAGTPKCRS